MQVIQAYLKKRGITGLWEINPKPDKKFHQAVVIPAYGEAELLPHTLTSMDKKRRFDSKKYIGCSGNQ